MNTRISTSSTYQRVLTGLHLNFSKLIRAQEQVSSGRKILRPSDDPTGTARALSFTRRLADTDRYLTAVRDGLTVVDGAAAALQSGSGLLTDVRGLLVQGMNGSLSQSDRNAIADQVELLRDQLFEIANSRSGDRFLFGGTDADQPPWSSSLVGGIERAQYAGNQDVQKIRIGVDVEIGINVPGTEVFAKEQASGIDFSGLTGLAAGSTANDGSGYEYVTIVHDATDPGTMANVGLALAGGGADDTFIGSHDLVVDATAGTVQLGSGPVLALPDPGAAGAADFVVQNGQGGELHLDFTGYTGADLTTAVAGSGSISIDGESFQPLGAETDLELVHPDSGNVVHVDVTGVGRAGVELVQFGGAVNTFDVLNGIVADLRNGDGLDVSDLVDRLGMRLGELDRNQDNLLVGLGALGSRSARMSGDDQRLQAVRVQLSSALSDVQDADYSEVVLEMTRAEQTLQLAQATGVRLMENSLLRFLN